MATPKEIFDQVLPWAIGYDCVPPELAGDADYQAAYALLRIVLANDVPPPARLAAVREYYDRTRGRASAPAQEVVADAEDLDLSALTSAEVAELERILGKARKPR